MIHNQWLTDALVVIGSYWFIKFILYKVDSAEGFRYRDPTSYSNTFKSISFWNYSTSDFSQQSFTPNKDGINYPSSRV